MKVIRFKGRKMYFILMTFLIVGLILNMNVNVVKATSYNTNLIINGDAESDFAYWTKTGDSRNWLAETAGTLNVSDSNNGGKIFNYLPSDASGGDVSINNDDSDEGSYTFGIQGTGENSAPTMTNGIALTTTGENMKPKVAKITFKNNTCSNSTADIVIFQKDGAQDSIVYAWHVIHNCRFAYTNCFEYNKTVDLVIKDSFGNQTVLPNVQKGSRYCFSKETGILEKSESLNPTLIEVQNLLSEGTITATISRNSKKIYEKTDIHPEEIVSFSPNNDIYVGRMESLTEGQVISEELIKPCSTKISLDNIKTADLVLKGGGFGPKAQEYYFELENIELER